MKDLIERLYHAVCKEDFDIAESLMNRGDIKINATNEDGLSLLHVAFQKS